MDYRKFASLLSCIGIVDWSTSSQLSQKTLDSLYANTSIKFAGGISDKDAYALARNMRCEPPWHTGKEGCPFFVIFPSDYGTTAIHQLRPLHS